MIGVLNTSKLAEGESLVPKFLIHLPLGCDFDTEEECLTEQPYQNRWEVNKNGEYKYRWELDSKLQSDELLQVANIYKQGSLMEGSTTHYVSDLGGEISSGIATSKVTDKELTLWIMYKDEIIVSKLQDQEKFMEITISLQLTYTQDNPFGVQDPGGS